MAGRPRTPTNVLELRGAFKRNPQRRRADEPEAIGELGDPPDHLTGLARDAWFELLGVIPIGVAAGSDRFAMEVFCTLVGQFRKNPEEFPATKLIRLEAMFGKFGLDPSSRAKLSIPKKQPKNEFEDF